MAKRVNVISRIFRQKAKTGEMLWYREYTNKVTGKREVRLSPCQNGIKDGR